MNPVEALQTIRKLVLEGHFLILDHARMRMRQRGMMMRDVREALTNATMCRLQDNGRWKTWGTDVDGDELIAIVEIQSSVLVVTLY